MDSKDACGEILDLKIALVHRIIAARIKENLT